MDTDPKDSPIHDLRELSKTYPAANIYFHMDLDGVTSGIAMREHLKHNGIRTIDATPIQYGGEEYAVKKSREGVLNVLVDFAHGKTWMDIHLDHHEEQVGVEEGTKTNFETSPSNVKTIQYSISGKEIFPATDIETISKVDSADYARHGITPDNVIKATFDYDTARSEEYNDMMLGLACNKLVLAYKNKPDFMSKVVMQSTPSLNMIYRDSITMAIEHGWAMPEKVDSYSQNYFKHRQEGMLADVEIDPEHIDRLSKDGGSAYITGSTTVVQKGGGKCWGGNQYDRYTIFKLYPDAHYLLTIWEGLGMIQLSKNPFLQMEQPYHLGEIAQKVLGQFQDELKNERITLLRLKFDYEKLIKKKNIKGAVGFTWADFEALFEGQITGIQSKNDWWPNMVRDITNKPSTWLSVKQRNILEKVTVSAWDVIQASSGGHKEITNISGTGFLFDSRSFLFHKYAPALAKEMADKRLTDK